jgi:hypothetical protein
MINVRIMTLVCLGLLGMITTSAKAGKWQEKTAFTFSTPVEIPGQVLEPGTYVFKLANSASDCNIVEVFNKDESHLYGISLAVPDDRRSRKQAAQVRNYFNGHRTHTSLEG